ncbi:MAG: hypothetical protein ACLFR6_06370 [Salinarchaeum sp.]
MDEGTAILVIHGVFALGLLMFGGFNIIGGNIPGGIVNVMMAIAFVAVGFFMSKHR